MTTHLLQDIGISEGESRIYEILLNTGSQTVSRIHEKAGIERRNIYDILNKLIQKGLVSYTKENRTRLFQVTHPNKILSYLDERKDKIERTREKVKEREKDLLKKFNATHQDYSASVFRGKEGIKSVWDDMLKEKSIFWMGSGGYVPRLVPHFHRRWNKERVKRKIPIKHLYRIEYKKNLDYDEVIGPLGEVKYLPKEFSGNPAAICVWGSKVGHFLFGDALFVFVIESKELASNYEDYFSYIWENVAT